MTDFKSLKSSTNSFAKLAENLAKQESNNSYEDKRFYTPNVDKQGNALVKLRFLPESDGEDTPFVKVFSHSFKNSQGKWFIENCRTTLGEQCFVCTENSKLWNSGQESDKAIARPRSRKTSFISNVYIIDDALNPENNGQVFLYRYGKKIYEKIKGEISPQFAAEQPCNIFDLWKGKNFKLKIRNHEGYRNYDFSSFEETPGVLLNATDEELEKIWRSQYKLMEFVTQGNFKPASDIERRYKEMYPEEFNSQPVQQSATETFSSKPVFDNVKTENKTTTEEDDDDLEMYKSLLG
jgi:hypothetical protein